MNTSTQYFLIVDTEKFAGDFEREMCAYMTGCVGDCGVGSGAAELFKKDVNDKKIAEWLEDNVEHVQDDHGTWRPAAASITPGMANDGSGNHYFVEEWSNNPQKIVDNYNKTRSESYSDRHVLVKDIGKISQYPAYCSVEMRFYEMPSKNILDIMVKRAFQFLKEDRKTDRFRIRCKPDKIVRVRFVERKTEVVNKDIEVFENV